MSVGPRVENFNIASDDHEHKRKCDFFVFVRKFPFWANLVKKIKIVSLSENLVPRLTRLCRIQWWCLLFPFLTGIIPFGLIWSKKTKLSLRLNFGICTNLNMQNSMVMFTFSIFDRNYPFWINLVQKNKTQFKGTLMQIWKSPYMFVFI